MPCLDSWQVEVEAEKRRFLRTGEFRDQIALVSRGDIG